MTLQRLQIGLLLGCLASSPVLAERIPVSSFVRHFQYTNAQISPDGRYVAAIYSKNHARDVVVTDLEKGESTLITGMSHEYLSGLRWASDQRLLLTLDYFGAQTEIFAINPDGSDPVNLFQPQDGKAQVQLGDELLHDLPDDPNHVLIEYGIDSPENPDVYKVNIYSGKRELVLKNKLDVRYWYADLDGAIRIGFAREGLQNRWYYRDPQKTEWQTLHEYNVATEPAFSVQGLSADGYYLYVSSRHAGDRAALYTYDPRKREFLHKILDHPRVDVVGPLLRAGTNGKLVAVGLYDDKPDLVIFDKNVAKKRQWLDERLAGRGNFIVSSDAQAEKFIVWSATARDPGAYWLWEPAQEKLEKLFTVAPWIAPRKMAETRPVAYHSRDGVRIPAYLTLPNDQFHKPTNKGWPTVIMPHGGPWARDGWGFDPMVQFLANRGYAVFQPNFRGSTGYGESFERAGYKQWGLRMQDDVTDGVRWLIKQNHADAGRICIYGASYGAFATLSGLTTTPDLYQCGIAEAGLYDLEKFLEGDKGSWFFEMQRVMVGDPVVDRKQLRNTSPIHHVSNIKAPLLVVHGDHDYRLNKDHAEQLVAALQKHAKPHEHLILQQGSHSRTLERNRMNLFRRVERFLKKHL